MSQFLHVMIILTSIAIYLRFKNTQLRNFVQKINASDVILIPVLLALGSLYVIPNESGAGMMSDRYILMFYMVLVLWVVVQPVPKKVSQFAVFIIIILHFGMLFKHQNGTIRKLNKDAITITETSKHIEAGSIVLPINLTDNWIEGHFSNYLGIEKPMVILENYETSVGWFPVHWNTPKMPKVLLGDKSSVSGVGWISNMESGITKQIDYVFLYGQASKLGNDNWQELNDVLKSEYSVVYTSENGYATLYKKNTK